jgi:hypothetical protein
MSRGKKQLAAIAAPTFIALLCVATPSAAFDSLTQQSPGVMFYMSVPLDGKAVKKEGPAFGMSMRGTREYEVVTLDSRMFNNFIGGGIEAKWIIAGVVAAGAAVAVASKDKSTSTSQQQQQNQQAAAQQQAQQTGGGGGGGGGAPCPVTPNCP